VTDHTTRPTPDEILEMAREYGEPARLNAECSKG
jgi:hypothetical protein